MANNESRALEFAEGGFKINSIMKNSITIKIKQKNQKINKNPEKIKKIYFLTTSVSIAAFLTASATFGTTNLSNVYGRTLSFVGFMQFAMA